MNMLFATVLASAAVLAAPGQSSDSQSAEPSVSVTQPAPAGAGASPAAFKPTEKQKKYGIEPLGVMQATFNGAERAWYPWRHHGHSQSEFEPGMNGTNVTIFGNATETSVPKQPGLIVSFTLTAGSAPKALNPSITDFDMNFAYYNYSSDNDGEATITIDKSEMTNGMLHVVGSFSARMNFRVMSKKKADTSNVKTIEDGSFDVYVPPASDD